VNVLFSFFSLPISSFSPTAHCSSSIFTILFHYYLSSTWFSLRSWHWMTSVVYLSFSFVDSISQHSHEAVGWTPRDSGFESPQGLVILRFSPECRPGLVST
jgi:hypothetical protein